MPVCCCDKRGVTCSTLQPLQKRWRLLVERVCLLLSQVLISCWWIGRCRLTTRVVLQSEGSQTDSSDEGIMSALKHYGHRYKISLGEVTRNCISNARLLRRPDLPTDLTFEGKVVIVTGGNRGIGRKVSTILVQRKVTRLIIACRDVSLGQVAADDIKKDFPETESTIVVYQLDLSSRESIRRFTEEITAKEAKVDALINNAAILTYDRRETIDGDEMMIGVNYFGTVMLTFLLFDHLKATSADPRIIFVSSIAHTETRRVRLQDMQWKKEGSFPFFQVYGHTKLALLLFLSKFAQKSKELGVLVYAVDPGVSKTDLGRDVNPRGGFSAAEIMLRGGIARPGMRSVHEAATSVLWPLAFKREEYDALRFNSRDGAFQEVSPGGKDQAAAEQLWNLTADHLHLPLMRSWGESSVPLSST